MLQNGRNRRSVRVINGKRYYGPPVRLERSYKSWNTSSNVIQPDWPNDLQNVTNIVPPKWLARLEGKNLTRALKPGWFITEKLGKKIRKKKRHFHNGEELHLKVSLPQTKHRMRIIKLKPAVNVSIRMYNYSSCNHVKKITLKLTAFFLSQNP